MPYCIDDCSREDFEAIKKHIVDLELDDRRMMREEFLTVSGTALAGFGRVREFNNFSEMCSLGILPGERCKGLGIELTRKLMEKALRPIYMVCVIPSFFETLGFTVCRHYPKEMQEKLDYCMSHLAVPEPYVVMTRH